MSNDYIYNLDKLELDIIREKIKYLKSSYNLCEVIRDDIFRILEDICTVLYYPVKDNIHAFSRLPDKFPNGKIVVFVNTNLTYEKQIFTAAYELAHVLIIKDRPEKFINKKTKGTLTKHDEESLHYAANVFASELLVDTDVLKKRLDLMGINKIDTLTHDHIVKLMDFFIFPYKSMLKRLYMIDFLSKEKFEELMLINPYTSNNPIFQLQNRLGLCSKNNIVTKLKKFSNFIDITIKAYEKKIISYDKLEHIFRLFDLKPSNFNIKLKPLSYLTREELEKHHFFTEFTFVFVFTLFI